MRQLLTKDVKHEKLDAEDYDHRQDQIEQIEFEPLVEINSVHSAEYLDSTNEMDDQDDDLTSMDSDDDESSDDEMYQKPRSRSRVGKSTDSGDTYKCTDCDKVFNKSYKLAKHAKQHLTEKKPHQCTKCNRRFNTEILLSRHDIVHSELVKQVKESRNDLECVICSREFPTKEELELHVREHKKQLEKGEISCQFCSKTFKRMVPLVRHLKTHDHFKTHCCTICEKLFSMGQDLIDHLNRHKGFHPHQCHLCDKSYVQACKLKSHLRSHTNEVNSIKQTSF